MLPTCCRLLFLYLYLLGTFFLTGILHFLVLLLLFLTVLSLGVHAIISRPFMHRVDIHLLQRRISTDVGPFFY